ncbi:MAG: DUF433 domain-containing protein [Acidobacteria bacterium]|nr:DUF433 domain-containing protein [Acidobacteriota bacterium]
MANLAERITVDPEQCGGRPCIRGMRIRVTDVLDLLANGLTPEQGLGELPDLPRAADVPCAVAPSIALDPCTSPAPPEVRGATLSYPVAAPCSAGKSLTLRSKLLCWQIPSEFLSHAHPS